MPPKPRPKYSQRVRNSGGINPPESTSMIRNQNNVQSGVLFAGSGYIAPLAINTFVFGLSCRAAFPMRIEKIRVSSGL